MPDQTAARRARELTKVFLLWGYHKRYIQIKGQILKQTLQAHITKSRATAYHLCHKRLT